MFEQKGVHFEAVFISRRQKEKKVGIDNICIERWYAPDE